MHEQVPAKVNALVDRRVKPLVDGLSAFPEVLTLDSCEQTVTGEAEVTFTLEGPPEALVRFVQSLSETLGDYLGRVGGFRLRTEWTAGSSRPLGVCLAQPKIVPELGKVLTEISAARMSPSGRGKRGTEPRS